MILAHVIALLRHLPDARMENGKSTFISTSVFLTASEVLVKRGVQCTRSESLSHASNLGWERVEREVGGGIGMGNTCKPMAVLFQCMTKFTTNKKKKKEGSSGTPGFLFSLPPSPLPPTVHLWRVDTESFPFLSLAKSDPPLNHILLPPPCRQREVQVY